MKGIEIPYNITVADIKYLKSMNLEIEQRNLKTFSFLKKIGAEYDDERTLYASLFMSGHSDPKNSNYSKLGEKLCGYFNKGTYGNTEENKKARNGIISYLKKTREEINRENEIEQEKIIEEHKKNMLNNPEYSQEFERQKNEMKNNMEKIAELMAIKKMNEKLRKDYSKQINEDNSSIWLKKTSAERKLAAGLMGKEKNKIIETVKQNADEMTENKTQKRGRGL